MSAPTVLIGLECGGTRTVALAATPDLRLLRRVEAGPANLRLVSDDALAGHFATLAAALPPPAAIGVGMAGVRDPADCRRVEGILERVWPGIPRAVDHDLESALAAADLGGRGRPGARIIILSGTGSCCYGRSRDGRLAKVGGWGHHLGDRGSAYDVAHTALRTMARHLDHTGRLGRFGREVLRHLQLNEPNDLIAWFQSAGKEAVAALAPVVFRTAGTDPTARQAVEQARGELAADALACARLLAGREESVEFVFAGSVLLKQPAFARRLGRLLQESQPGRSRPLRRESAWGAVAMARRVAPRSASRPGQDAPPQVTPAIPPPPPAGEAPFIPRSRELSPTERRHPGSAHLDRMPLARAIDLMLDEEGVLTAALRAERESIGKLVRLAVRSLGQGGRLFYVGAGTSGRLGVLDASECPPTFRTDPGLVQGIMAGGLPALHSAVEGAEDDPGAGRRAIEARGVGPRDLVVGLAASGRTPFVWGALDAARTARART
ncbi:MAG: N-acetylmuramic acid 6-phosphate etherase, partial [Verrucomicrobiota bacterium]